MDIVGLIGLFGLILVSMGAGAVFVWISLANTVKEVELEARNKLERAYASGVRDAVATIAGNMDPIQYDHYDLTTMVRDAELID